MIAGTTVSADAIRGYIRTLRQERKVTQPVLAKAINMALRTYKDWELGNVTDIKAPYLLRAVQFLNGSYEQIASLPDEATAEDGEALARAWVVEQLGPTPNETPEERARLTRLIDLLAEGVPPQEAAEIVRREQ